MTRRVPLPGAGGRRLTDASDPPGFHLAGRRRAEVSAPPHRPKEPSMPSATEPEVCCPRRRAAVVVLTAVSCLALTALAAPKAIAAPAPSSGCAAVNIITARASTEAQGEG